MKPTAVHTFFFSPTGTSKRIADAVARGLAREIQAVYGGTGVAGAENAERVITGAGCDGAGASGAGSAEAAVAGSGMAGAAACGAETAGTRNAGVAACGAETAGTRSARAAVCGAETAGAEQTAAEHTATGTAGAAAFKAETAGTRSAGAAVCGTQTTGTEQTAAEHTATGTTETTIVAENLTHTAAQGVTLPADAAAVFAAPVYGGRIAPAALERMEALRGSETPAVVIAVYGNRAFEGAAAQLAAFVAEQGFVPVAAAAFVGEHSYSSPATPIAAGRPDARDVAEAEAFGAAVAQKLAAGKPEPVDAARLRAPRTPLWPLLRFIAFVLRYRRRQRKHPVVLVPAGDKALCTECGRCAALCPTQAIGRDDLLHSDPARCIRCNACVKGCPFGARSYPTPFAAALARSFRRRKPPVTLL